MPSSITLTVSHLPTSTSFFLATLQPLGYVYRGRQEQTIGFGPANPPTTPADFWITQEIPGVPAGAAHVAFPAASRSQVQDFFVAALRAGGKIHGEPCQRDASGYYSAAVIDFDGNSIEAVCRPVFNDEANKENADTRSMVSGRNGSVKAPRSVVSQARSQAPPLTVVSQAKSKTPSQKDDHPKPKPSGDVLDALINDARSAANVARDLVSSFKSNSSASPPSAPSNNATGATGSGAGDAIVGTLLGMAAGAALTYAFGNHSKEGSHSDDDRDEHKFQPRRLSVVGRSMTDPAKMRPEYSSAPSDHHTRGKGDYRRAIEAAPSSYTYSSRTNRDGQKLIAMHDHDPPAPTAITHHSSHSQSPQSDYASTIRPTRPRTSTVDSGFGPGPRDLESLSRTSSKASRHSRKSLPPTSYRAPTVLTEKLSSSPKDASDSGAKSRATSLTRLGRSHSRPSEHRSRSHSRSQSHTHSRHSRRDSFEAASSPSTIIPATSTPPSRAPSSSHSHSRRDPTTYPLPPSRAATWAGSDSGKTFVSARSNLISPNNNPRTVIGRSSPLTKTNLERESASVVSKSKEVRDLDVSDREVRPEDSVSQISTRSRRSRTSVRR